MKSERRAPNQKPDSVRVWDLPLRIWHWCFAASIVTALATGLSGELGLVDWHMRAGYAVLALLAFRCGWLCWGGRHARWSGFRLHPRYLLATMRRKPTPGVRTAPGAWLAAGFLGSSTLQALAGLFTSDFIFTDGPLVRHATDSVVKVCSSLHHRVYWVVVGLIILHLCAHVAYGLARDSTPLAMITGRKRVVAEPTPDFWLRAVSTAAAVVLLGWLVLRLI
jgi:cytochrome b